MTNTIYTPPAPKSPITLQRMFTTRINRNVCTRADAITDLLRSARNADNMAMRATVQGRHDDALRHRTIRNYCEQAADWFLSDSTPDERDQVAQRLRESRRLEAR